VTFGYKFATNDVKMAKAKKYPNSVAEQSQLANEPSVAYSYSNTNEYALLKVIRDGITYEEFDRVKDNSGLSLSDWANYLNLSERTLLRYAKNDENLDKGTSERVIEIALLQERAVEVFGNISVFHDWINTPLRALGNVKPKDFLDSSIGIQILMNVLGRIEHGIPS